MSMIVSKLHPLWCSASLLKCQKCVKNLGLVETVARFALQRGCATAKRRSLQLNFRSVMVYICCSRLSYGTKTVDLRTFTLIVWRTICWQIQWNLDLTNCQGPGKLGSLNQGFVISRFAFHTFYCDLNSLGWRLSFIGIILKLHSPRYPVNITFQGAAAKRSHIFVCFCFVTF